MRQGPKPQEPAPMPTSPTDVRNAALVAIAFFLGLQAAIEIFWTIRQAA